MHTIRACFVALLPLAVSGALMACAYDASATRATVRDSAGVRIIENGAADAASERWVLSADPVADIGAIDGDEAYQLDLVMSVAILSDGRLVAANMGTNDLRVFDERGAHLLTLGREGGGPGEFRNLHAVWAAPGDSIFAWDYSERRLSVFAPDGEFARSAQVTSTRQHFGRGILADGTLAIEEPLPQPRLEPGTVVDFEHEVIRYDAGGKPIDTLGRQAAARTALIADPRGRINAVPVAFGPSASVAVRGNRIVMASGRLPELRSYDVTTGRLTLIRWSEPSRAVNESDRTQYREGLLARAPTEAARERTLQRMNQLRFAEHFPAHGRVLLDRSGRAWVERWRNVVEEGPAEWMIFSPDGRLLASVETPSGLRVLDVGDDVVVGVARDDLDVEYVRAYRITRDESG